MTHPTAIIITLGIAIGSICYAYFSGYFDPPNSERPHYPGPSNSEPSRPRVRRSSRRNSSLSSDCCICLNTLNSDDMISLPCDHEFHRSCISQWRRMNHGCPLCRQHFN